MWNLCFIDALLISTLASRLAFPSDVRARDICMREALRKVHGTKIAFIGLHQQPRKFVSSNR
jgi:hypothetical protein